MNERLHVITNQARLASPIRGLTIEAHFDDTTMSVVDVSLAKKNVGLTIATLTDSAARKLSKYTAEDLRLVRRQECIQAAETIGAAQVYAADLPDGELFSYQDEAADFLAQIIKDNPPDFLIAPHPLDPHLDHAAAGAIARRVADGEIPVYFMDTITGVDTNGDAIIPTHYVKISRRDVRQRKKAYYRNKSQVEDLPDGDIFDVFDVLRMPRRRGNDIGVPFAGALIKDQSGHKSDPIAEIFKGDVFIRNR